jgi:glycyl-tRNA synthetase alpha chain
MYIQQVDNIMDIEWGGGVRWGELNMQAEKEFSRFHFDVADTGIYFGIFEKYRWEAMRMLDEELILPAYDYILKCSHIFNILDARGAISVSERTSYIGKIRDLARQTAEAYVARREKLGFPLMKSGDKGRGVRGRR